MVKWLSSSVASPGEIPRGKNRALRRPDTTKFAKRLPLNSALWYKSAVCGN